MGAAERLLPRIEVERMTGFKRLEVLGETTGANLGYHPTTCAQL